MRSHPLNTLDPELRHRMLMESHRLVNHLVPIFAKCRIHGSVFSVEPHRVVFTTHALPSQFFNSQEFRRPVDRWRVILPARDGHPPVVIRMEGRFVKWGSGKRFELKHLDARWVSPPSNTVNEPLPRVSSNVRYF